LTVKVEFNRNKETGGLLFAIEFEATEALEAGVIDKVIELGGSVDLSYREIMPIVSEIVIAIAEVPGQVHTTEDIGFEAMTIPLKDLSLEGIKAVSRVGTIMSTACGLGICETCKGDPCQHACHAN
jgi:hypothetical protein